jgi:hypothetical protein
MTSFIVPWPSDAIHKWFEINQEKSPHFAHCLANQPDPDGTLGVFCGVGTRNIIYTSPQASNKERVMVLFIIFVPTTPMPLVRPTVRISQFPSACYMPCLLPWLRFDHSSNNYRCSPLSILHQASVPGPGPILSARHPETALAYLQVATEIFTRITFTFTFTFRTFF